LSENPNPPYPCWRYTTALDKLSKADTYSVELFRDIVKATHQELPYFPTLYSNIYDLKKGLIYVYLYHDFENVVVFDIAAELAKGFPPTQRPRITWLNARLSTRQRFPSQLPPRPNMAHILTMSEIIVPERWGKH
jgi:hypothetical protein